MKYLTFISFVVIGTDTTSTFLEWLVYYMIAHPELQEKMQNEIDHVIGSRASSLKDRPMMPFTEAVIEEASRITPLSTLGLPHVTAKDTNIGPYFCPKGTNVSLSHQSSSTKE